MTRKKLYIILTAALAAGFAFLFYEFWSAGKGSLPDLCIFRHVTGIPCPSCGSTRSVISLMHGDFTGAFFLNPAGFIIAAIMFSAPLWMIFDLVTGKKTLFNMYLTIEKIVRKPLIAAPLICLVVLNWIWNIIKGI